MARQIGEILLSPRRIAARVRRLGAALARAYAGRDPLLVAVMKGCVVFVADLVRVWPGPLDLEFVSAESYVGTRPGRVRVALPPGLARRVAGRPVLVIDDIYDTGATLAEVCRALEALRPAEIRSLVMFRRKRPPRAARPRTGAMLSRRCESMPRPRSALAATRAACTVPPDRPLRPPRRPRGRPAGAAPPQDAAFAGPDWVGFDIPDGFVIGYGLDYRGRYRNLPCLAVLRPRKGSC